MANMLRRVITENVELKLSLSQLSMGVKVDPGQMEQLILNLCVNARDAMPLGGKLTITTSSYEPTAEFLKGHPDMLSGTYSVLSISDTGEGMAREVIQHIFEPFFTTKEKGKGTGLGLSMVYGIAKQSNGEIIVQSAPGSGTVFKVYLPRNADVLSGSMPAPQPRSSLAGSETVLFVDDDSAIRQLGARVLRASGYKVIEARGGEDALHMLQEYGGTIDVLVTDVVMPGMSGRELAKQVASRQPGLKTIFISGYTDNVIAHHGVLEPGINLLPKPFTLEILVSRVREALDAE